MLIGHDSALKAWGVDTICVADKSCGKCSNRYFSILSQSHSRKRVKTDWKRSYWIPAMFEWLEYVLLADFRKITRSERCFFVNDLQLAQIKKLMLTRLSALKRKRVITTIVWACSKETRNTRQSVCSISSLCGTASSVHKTCPRYLLVGYDPAWFEATSSPCVHSRWKGDVFSIPKWPRNNPHLIKVLVYMSATSALELVTLSWTVRLLGSSWLHGPFPAGNSNFIQVLARVIEFAIRFASSLDKTCQGFKDSQNATLWVVFGLTSSDFQDPHSQNQSKSNTSTNFYFYFYQQITGLEEVASECVLH